MSDYHKIDDAAIGADTTHSAALAQMVADNAQGSRDRRLRRCSVSWDKRDAPLMWGAYSWVQPSDAPTERVLLPIIWRRSSTDVTELTLRVRGLFAAAGTIVLGAVVLGMSGLEPFPRNVPANHAEDDVTASPTVQTIEIVVSDINLPDEEVMILITVLSSLTGSSTLLGAVGAIETYGVIAATAEPTGRSLLVMSMVIDPVAGGGLHHWFDGRLPSPRQIIAVEADTLDSFYVYPPFDPSGVVYGDLTEHEFYKRACNGMLLLAVEVEETSIRAFPSYQAALNPDGAVSAIDAQTILYGRNEETFLTQTTCWAIGPPSPDVEEEDSNFSGKMLNKMHAVVPYGTDSTERSIASCYVGGSADFRDIDGSTEYLCSTYEVTAMFAVAGVAYSGAPQNPVMPFEVRLGLTALGTGPSELYSTSTSMRPKLFNFHTNPLADRNKSDPIGYLLRLSYNAERASESIAHNMLGIYPEDIWHSGRPVSNPAGNFVFYRGSIKDEEDTARRKLNLWVTSTATAQIPAYLHCISWCVTTQTTEFAEDMAALGVVK